MRKFFQIVLVGTFLTSLNKKRNGVSKCTSVSIRNNQTQYKYFNLKLTLMVSLSLSLSLSPSLKTRNY